MVFTNVGCGRFSGKYRRVAPALVAKRGLMMAIEKEVIEGWSEIEFGTAAFTCRTGYKPSRVRAIILLHSGPLITSHQIEPDASGSTPAHGALYRLISFGRHSSGRSV
jgi:hypothetical protein